MWPWVRQRDPDLESGPDEKRDSRRYKSRWEEDRSPPPRKVSKAKRKVRRAPSLDPPSFGNILADAALQKHKLAPLYADRHGMITIRLRALQHMVVCTLRRDLAEEVKKIYDTKSAPSHQMERLRKTMKHYVGALRDLRYMLEAPSQNEAVSQFLIKQLYITESKDAAIMADVGFVRTRGDQPDFHLPDYTGYGGYNYLQGSAAQQTKEFVGRLKMALFGGLSLIAPMLIMRLHHTLLTELVTTSVFILVVGIVLAWYMKDAQKRDIMAATASYAAVLVVFVGATS